MLSFWLRRLVQGFLLVLGVVLIVFTLLRFSIAGDPARIKAALPAVSDEILQGYKAEFNLDKPFSQQLYQFFAGLVAGDLGTSFRYRQPVKYLIGSALPITLRLAFSSELLVILIVLLLGIAGGRHPGSFWDRFGAFLALIGQSAPMFWVGLMLISIFAIRLQWLPGGGYSGFTSLILPVITIALSVLPASLRVVRTNMIDVLGQDYIRTARAYGHKQWRINYVYALRNVAIPAVTIIGIDLGALLSGTIVAEIIFNLQGIGNLALIAMNARDFPLIQGITIVTSSLFVFINILVDFTYSLINPMIKANMN